MSIMRGATAVVLFLTMGVLAETAALAAGTTAGTTVSNTATIDYQVSGTSQPQTPSNTVTFLVDRKINLVVAQVGGASTQVAPGQLAQVTTFTVTNTSNAPLDFALAATQQVGGAAPFGGKTDNFDATNVRVYVDSNANGVYDPGVDTATYLDEIPADAVRTVFIVVDIPNTRVNGDTAAVALTATASEPGTPGSLGTTVLQTSTADNPAVVDTVYADGAGNGGDTARDGKYSAKSQFDVVTASIALVKLVRTVSDPYNGTTNPKAIPGATMEYCLIVRNTGSASANSIVLNDLIPTGTTYVAGSARTEGATIGTGATEVCDTTTATTGGVAAGATYASNTVTATIATVPVGTDKAARFSVTVN